MLTTLLALSLSWTGAKTTVGITHAWMFCPTPSEMIERQIELEKRQLAANPQT